MSADPDCLMSYLVALWRYCSWLFGDPPNAHTHTPLLDFGRGPCRVLIPPFSRPSGVLCVGLVLLGELPGLCCVSVFSCSSCFPALRFLALVFKCWDFPSLLFCGSAVGAAVPHLRLKMLTPHPPVAHSPFLAMQVSGAPPFCAGGGGAQGVDVLACFGPCWPFSPRGLLLLFFFSFGVFGGCPPLFYCS